MAVRDIAVVGAGIVGAAVARELTLRLPDVHVTVLEKEFDPAAHQTGHNSGVVHAGLYYEPGGLKARLCRRGVGLLREFCADRSLPYQECGKVVVALDAGEEPRLASIFERAKANGVPDVEMLGPDGLHDVEPGAVGVAALHSPRTAIVDYVAVTRALLADVEAAGGEVRYNSPVERLTEQANGVLVQWASGRRRFDLAITCGGLQSDRLARASGAPLEPTIVPFFGQYFRLEPAYREAVRGLVYPVPDPRYPFLGVHLTKRVDGELLLGPNAFLSPGRESYGSLGFSVPDLLAIAAEPGFWRFAARNLPTAGREIRTVVSRRRFVAEAARYVPAVADADVVPIPRGIRAQALNRDGSLVDDFVIQQVGRATHVRNAPSPGATSSMAIAEHIVDAVGRTHGLTLTPRE